MEKNKELKDTHSYKGWLNSDSFWKRVWAIYGYGAIGIAVVWIFLIVIVLLIELYFGS